ncbi:vacuolar protein sorting-associated protein 8 homolog isoform X2 [Neltuma alba]|uniref:vacuolar protein sorting-associated protein 8 homolog isoform X2 n=1 Tax=Neltuma alba TaxID=207710 RepID=UPI0010A5528D|nr:vacuolar protein sorting-associated protein 8 homolog isoform X2 [Prosopis alba]
MSSKLVTAESPSMDLDLDSFLNSPASSDDENDDNSTDAAALRSVPHRTVDEILNDCDTSSSSSSSPPPSPSSYLRQTHRPSDPTVTSQASSSRNSVSEFPLDGSQKNPEPQKLANLDDRIGQSRASYFSRVKPAEKPDDRSLGVLRPFSTLFPGVRSNAKPGAALAAAAAASRSIPTPHAAAIKSRRAGSGTLQKVQDSGELNSTIGDDSDISSNGDLGGAGLYVSKSSEKSEEVDEKLDDYQSSEVNHVDQVSKNVETFEDKLETVPNVHFENEAVVATEVDNSNPAIGNVIIEQQNDSSSVMEENKSSEEYSAIPCPSNIENGIETSVSACEPNSRRNTNSDPFVDKDFNENKSPYIDTSNKGLNADGSNTASAETEELANANAWMKDDEDNLTDDGNDDGSSSTSDVSELVKETLEQLENKRASRRAEKKLHASKKPLELAEELEKKHASTGLHWEEGAAAQPMRLEGVRRGSTTLGYFDTSADNVISRVISSQTFRREHGSPQVLAVHANYIAVGMTKGLIFAVPSRYSPYHADNMDGKMLMLGMQGDRSHVPVTSMSFNQQGDLLLAGYGDGRVIVWDVHKAVVAKVISGEHTAPVVHAFFLGQDPQNTRQFKAITGDSKGLVLLHSISLVPLLNRFSSKSQCLLDGERTGLVLSASPLLSDEFSGSASSYSQGNTLASTSSITSMMGGVVGGDAGWKLFNEGSSLIEEGVVIFVTHQNILVVRLCPSLEVYARLLRPDGIREGSMPYTAWKYMGQYQNRSVEAVERVSLLAIAWDRKVQVAKLVKSELKFYGKWSLDSAAIGLAWLDDQMLVVLSSAGQLYLFGKDGTVIHKTNIGEDGIGGDDLVVYHTQFINIFGNPEKAYHNSIAVRGASIYILGPTHLVVSRLLPWKERILVLRKAGDWMGALNMAMTLYDGQAHGVIDLPRNLDAVQEIIMPFLLELLTSYVDEVFSYISVAFCNQLGKVDQSQDSNGGSSSVHSEIKEQYVRVGGVAVEFCVHIKRTDILFDEIFSKFVDVQQRDTFLELLEPYILKDMLGSLPPEIMQALVEHYSTKGWLLRVEQCVLHMDISSLDFNQVVRLCQEHGLYSALVYLFNKGLDDFRTPLEELFAVLQSSQKESATTLGYRMLVYLKYCFTGLAFPPGRGTIPPPRLPSLRKELVELLLEESNVLKSQRVSDLGVIRPCLNLYLLLELDTEATLDVLRSAFVEDEISNSSSSSVDLANRDDEDAKKGIHDIMETQNLLVQNTVDALIRIIDKIVSPTDTNSVSGEDGSLKEWPSNKDIGHIYEFIAYYVALQRAKVSRSVLFQILEYLTSDSVFPISGSLLSSTSEKREKQVLALLKVLPEPDWDPSYVLGLCERAQFHQVCGFIHAIRHEHVAALDSYMKDADEPIHAFSFINTMLMQLTGNERAAIRSAVISRIPKLVELSREGTFLMVIIHFSDESSHIITELHSHRRSLFLYLKTLVEVHLSGTLDLSKFRKGDIVDATSGKQVKDNPQGVDAFLDILSNIPKYIRESPIHVTDDLIELYLELLCQYEGGSVLKFLETFDSYRVEHCLRLCQEYGIIDAAAFLLERVGDVGSALLLTLSSLSEKFVELDAAVETVISNPSLKGSSRMKLFNTVSRMKEVNDIQSSLHACIGLCQRNTPRLNPEESEAHWFKLLDSFCDPLLDSYVDERASERENYFQMFAGSPVSKLKKDTGKSRWKISKSHGADVLRRLFSLFIKEIVEGMIGYVHLPTIMSKLLSDNGSQEFGDFKLTILGMLGTYGFERRILDAAKSLIEDDTFYTMSLLKKGASHGYAPRSIVCCICNSLLTKNSVSSGVRVFNCGHATHLHCEALDVDLLGRGSQSGCPVCMPTQKFQQPKSKSVVAENGLVNKFSSRRQHSNGSTFHPHESDLSENTYGPQQTSRFEILSSLHKDQRFAQIESLPQLRLAPPALYHEKVNRVTDLVAAESSSSAAVAEKQSQNKQNRELRVKGSAIRFPLKSSIFGKEKNNKR